MLSELRSLPGQAVMQAKGSNQILRRKQKRMLSTTHLHVRIHGSSFTSYKQCASEVQMVASHKGSQTPKVASLFQKVNTPDFHKGGLPLMEYGVQAVGCSHWTSTPPKTLCRDAYRHGSQPSGELFVSPSQGHPYTTPITCTQNFTVVHDEHMHAAHNNPTSV